MSLQGLTVRSRRSRQVLEITDDLTRFRYGTEVGASTSGSVTLGDIVGQRTFEFSIPTEEALLKASHIVSRSGAVVSWSPSPNLINRVTAAASAVYVFMV